MAEIFRLFRRAQDGGQEERIEIPDIDGGGAGPEDPGMEARVARLEADIKEIKADLKRVGLDVAEIKGKVSNLPTTIHLFYMQAGLVAALFAAAFALLKLAGH